MTSIMQVPTMILGTLGTMESILHAMGMNHERLTYHHNGLDERPTIQEGEVVHKVFS